MRVMARMTRAMAMKKGDKEINFREEGNGE